MQRAKKFFSTSKKVMIWLRHMMGGSGRLEEICAGASMLDNLVEREAALAVLFCGRDDDDDGLDEEVTSALEEVDARLRAEGQEEDESRRMLMVRCSDSVAAEEYGREKCPELVLFRRGVPTSYHASLADAEQVLDWLRRLRSSLYFGGGGGRGRGRATAEVVTDARLEKMLSTRRHVAVLFCERESNEEEEEEDTVLLVDKSCAAAMAAVEGVEEELRERAGVAVVKTADGGDADEYGVADLPALVLFDNGVPSTFAAGDVSDGGAILEWILARTAPGSPYSSSPPWFLGRTLRSARELEGMLYGMGKEKAAAVMFCDRCVNAATADKR